MFKLYPNQVMVPTLDIDLVWHTHQCSPAQYNATMTAMAGQFIDHDDKISKCVLDDGLQKTSQLFRIRFGEEYTVCTCWDCEALLSAVTTLGALDSTDENKLASSLSETLIFHREVEIARRRVKPEPADSMLTSEPWLKKGQRCWDYVGSTLASFANRN